MHTFEIDALAKTKALFMWLWWITEINSRYRRHLLDFEQFTSDETKRNGENEKQQNSKRYVMRWNDGKG